VLKGNKNLGIVHCIRK